MIQHISVGIIKEGVSFLVCRRPAGKIMAGLWEFPGGKRKEGETSMAALEREFYEELDIVSLRAHLLLSHYYEWHCAFIQLEIWQITSYAGTIRPKEGQQILWCAYPQLARLNLLPANASFLPLLRHYCTG